MSNGCSKNLFDFLIDKRMFVRYNNHRTVVRKHLFIIKGGIKIMTKNNKRVHYRKHSSKRNKGGKIGFILSFYVITMIFSYFLGFSNNFVKADSEMKPVYVDSRVVKQGETLWSIAQSYDSVYYSSTKDYVDAIKECNNLTGDEISAGVSLVIPYTK